MLAAGYFVFSLFFSFITFVLWVRFALRYFRVSALHPVARVFYQLSDPVLLPMARIMRIPNTRQSRYDWTCFIALVIVEIIKFLLTDWMFFANHIPAIWLILYPIADLIVHPLSLLFYAILIRVVMSWINPAWRNPFSELLVIFTEPLLSPIRQRLPYLAGIDFSPFIVLVAIKMITVFISVSMPMHLV